MARKTVFVLRRESSPLAVVVPFDFDYAKDAAERRERDAATAEAFRRHVADELAKPVPVIVEPEGYTVTVEDVEVTTLRSSLMGTPVTVAGNYVPPKSPFGSVAGVPVAPFSTKAG